MKKSPCYLSRFFVEFGPFEPGELLSFKERGLLQDTDHLRPVDSDDWVSCSEYFSNAPDIAKAIAPRKVLAKKVAAATKAATKAASKTPATKSAKKKA